MTEKEIEELRRVFAAPPPPPNYERIVRRIQEQSEPDALAAMDDPEEEPQ